MNIYIAKYESRHFHFEGFGATTNGALDTLKSTLESHATIYDLDSDWYCPDGIYVQQVILGRGYRDGQEVSI